MMRSKALSGVMIGCALLGASSLSAIATAAGRADFSGEWAIDRDASDEPADVLEPVTRRSSGRFGGIQAGVSVFGFGVADVTDLFPDRDKGGTEPQDETRRELGKLQRHLTEALTKIDIEQSPEQFRVVYDDLGIYIYQTGQTVEYADTTVTAGWRGDRYVVEREVAEGPRVTEVFRMDGSGTTLHWIVTIELESRRDVTIDRVFERNTDG